MNNKNLSGLMFCVALIIVGCSKDSTLDNDLAQSQQGSDLSTTKKASQGATQLSGIGFFDAADECNFAGQGATFSINMTGDLAGCLYTFVDEFECSPSGTYREIGRDYFVGTYNGESGTFWTTYKFEGKYEGCAEDGSYIGAEIKGRCQHPLVEDSGTGVFDGVKGILLFKDDIEAGNYPYRLHLNQLN